MIYFRGQSTKEVCQQLLDGTAGFHHDFLVCVVVAEDIVKSYIFTVFPGGE